MIFWTRTIWEITSGDNLAIHLKSYSWYLWQLSFVEKKNFSHFVFRLLQISMVLVLWCGSSEFCCSRTALTTPSYASSEEVCAPCHTGQVSLPCPAVCLWPFAPRGLLCTRSPCVNTSTSHSSPPLNHWSSEHFISSTFFFQSWLSLVTLGKQAYKMCLIFCEVERR